MVRNVNGRLQRIEKQIAPDKPGYDWIREKFENMSEELISGHIARFLELCEIIGANLPDELKEIRDKFENLRNELKQEKQNYV